MSWKYVGKNYRPFSALCQNSYGRKIIKTKQNEINASNIVDELTKALVIHNQNALEIQYLDRYYRGDQPILYRKKEIRPEVNNKIVKNIALMIVDTHTSEVCGEPIQYVLHGTEESKSEEIAALNKMMESEDKSYHDIELCRWRSICGTAYRYIGENTEETSDLLDESEFYISTEDPTYTFIVYYQNGKPAFSVQIREDENGESLYNCYTKNQYFLIRNSKIIKSKPNGNKSIPVVEYPNNSRRLSDIEITIFITDALNTMSSDRVNGIEQFVSSWIKFINCEVDSESFLAMRQEGALVVKSNNGSDNKADVDVMTSELNQSESQVAVNDMYEMLLVIQGIGNREGNTGGDTQGAVMLRNGFYTQEKRTELTEPIFIKSERQMLRIVLNKLRVKKDFSLMPSDVEVKISRTKRDNMQVKAQVLQILLSSGIEYSRAIKVVGLFSDPEQVAIESRDRMQYLYPTEDKQTVTEKVVVTDGEN